MASLFDPTHKLRRAVRNDFASAAQAYPAYTQLQHSMADIAAALLAERLRTLRFPRVLDAGCGTGYALQHLRAHVPASLRWGVDLAHSMCVAARTHLQMDADAMQPEKLICADMTQLPLPPNSMDGLISSAALQWAPDTEQTLAEWARVVRPGGWAAITSFGPATLHELRNAFATVDRWPHVQRFLSRDELVEVAEAAGWRVEHAASHAQPLLYASPLALMQQLRGMGARNKRLDRRPSLFTPRQLQQVVQAYPARADGQISATWDVVVLVLQREGDAI